MTYRELLQKEHPENVDEEYVGGCFKCPSSYGYEADNANGQPCLKHVWQSDVICAACWNREIPGSEPLESGGAQTGGLISRSALLADLREKGFLPAIVKRTIERAPTVDALEVVRCRNCKYIGGGDEICDMDYCWKHNRTTKPDGYCHAGQEKDRAVRRADNGTTDKENVCRNFQY